MGNLFRSGAVFMAIAVVSGLAALVIVVKGLMTDDLNIPVACGTIANALIWFIVANAVKRKNQAVVKPDTER